MVVASKGAPARRPARRAPGQRRAGAGGGGGAAIPFGQPPAPRQTTRPPRRLYSPAGQNAVQVAGPRPVVVDPQQSATRAVKGAPRVLMAEFLACLVIVAAKPFEKTGDNAKISEGSIGQFAAVMILFFILALFGGVSGKTQKIANLFGGLVTLGLLFKNTATLKHVSGSITASTKAPATPAATGTIQAGGTDTAAGRG